MRLSRLGRGPLTYLAFVLALMLALPAIAAANDVSDPVELTALNADEPFEIGTDGHQVCRVTLSAGDWLVGHTSAVPNAPVTMRILTQESTSVTSAIVATSTDSGITFWQAPEDGVYYCDYSAEPGMQLLKSLHVSHPVLTLDVATKVIVPYKGATTLACTLSDPHYTYVPFDGPALGFESVGLDVSSDGRSWTPLRGSTTNLNGGLVRTVSGMTRTTRFRFAYDGALYDSVGFGAATSTVVTVVPRALMSITGPSSASRAAPFTVTGTLEPRCAAGVVSVRLQARRYGDDRVLVFPVSAGSATGSSSPLRARPKLPTRGTWYVRLYRPETSLNAVTTTRWVRIEVR